MCSQTPGWHPPSPTHHTLKCGPDWLLCPGRSDIETPLVAPGCNYKGIQLEWKVTHTFRTGFVGLGPERELVSKPLPWRVQETEAEGSWCAWPFVSRRTWGHLSVRRPLFCSTLHSYSKDQLSDLKSRASAPSACSSVSLFVKRRGYKSTEGAN